MHSHSQYCVDKNYYCTLCLHNTHSRITSITWFLVLTKQPCLCQTNPELIRSVCVTASDWHLWQLCTECLCCCLSPKMDPITIANHFQTRGPTFYMMVKQGKKTLKILLQYNCDAFLISSNSTNTNQISFTCFSYKHSNHCFSHSNCCPLTFQNVLRKASMHARGDCSGQSCQHERCTLKYNP